MKCEKGWINLLSGPGRLSSSSFEQSKSVIRKAIKSYVHSGRRCRWIFLLFVLRVRLGFCVCLRTKKREIPSRPLKRSARAWRCINWIIIPSLPQKYHQFNGHCVRKFGSPPSYPPSSSCSSSYRFNHLFILNVQLVLISVRSITIWKIEMMCTWSACRTSCESHLGAAEEVIFEVISIEPLSSIEYSFDAGGDAREKLAWCFKVSRKVWSEKIEQILQLGIPTTETLQTFAQQFVCWSLRSE